LIRLLLALCIFLNLSYAVSAEQLPSRNGKLKEISWVATPEMKLRFKSYFDEFTGKTWDVLKFKIKVDQIIKELFNNGYFSSTVKTELQGTESDIIVKMTIVANERTNFQFLGNTVFSHQELRKSLIEKIKNDFGKTDKVALSNFIVETYEGAGFYNNRITSYQNEGRDLDGVAIKNYFFEIQEGEKLKVSSVVYRGNNILSGEDLERLFKKTATPLASAGYYDKSFFENFTAIITKEYLSKGFVFAEVSKPRLATNEDDETISIEFGIAEKQQVILKSITLNRIASDQESAVKKMLTNKEGEPLNVVELEADLKKMVLYFQGEGYYFTSIANLNSENLLTYDKSYSFVELKPDIVLDKQICFNEAIVSGNAKTQSEVIFREIEINRGELITPAKLELVRQKLSGLGLFSTLRISPYIIDGNSGKSCAKTNLVIQVKEKDFGLFEVAPGYRTDLGAKLSTGVTYNNFLGMNRSASFKLQANRRFNLDGFDDRRREENKQRLEYLGKVSYVEPYLLHNFIKTQVELELASSFQRKRFYGFDADIFRISPQLSKNITKNLSTSVKYQFERINQVDATVAKDNDNFSIGGITPSITYDRRNDPINPKSGYYLNFSSEWANSYFGSMKNADLEVNYIKFITRNKFYYPVGDFTLALSWAMGYEKNFAEDILRDSTGQPFLNSNGAPRTHGYIPSIKVFRLDGYDEIRGYDDGEINRLKSGQPIGDVVVQNEAYFTAFKFEPRYNITDAIQIGVFFDAGRVFIDHFQPFDLRTSVGSGLKFLTPVGSLDFDYGIKLQRRTNPDNKRDSVGRFHLSIGFF
jgi:outer membrane protein insertion porin family